MDKIMKILIAFSSLLTLYPDQKVAWIIFIGYILLIVFNFLNINNLIVIQVVYSLMFQMLITIYELPQYISYLLDFNLILILIVSIIRYSGKRNIKIITGAILLLVLIGGISNYIYDFNFLLYLWGIRNTFRIFIFLVVCLLYINKETAERVYSIVKYIFIFHILFASYQYFVLGFSGDYLGGVFGTTIGTANTYSNAFMIILFCLIFVKNTYSRIKLIPINIYLLLILYIATISELKAIYIEVSIVIVCIVFYIRKSSMNFLKLGVFISSIILVFSVTINLLYILFPNFSNFFDLNTVLEYSSNGYTGINDIGRLSFYDYVRENMFNYNNLKTLIGIGLGNAEYSSSELFVSNFYNIYKNTNYTWFSAPMIFIELGLIGLIVYISIFLYIGVEGFKIKTQYSLISALCSFSCIFLFIYNSSLRTELAYFLAFFLSSIYIKENSEER